jgi:hypothetical protein
MRSPQARASSSRNQVAARAASAAAYVACGRPYARVRWHQPRSVAIATQSPKADLACAEVFTREILVEFITGSADHLVGVIVQCPKRFTRGAVENPGSWRLPQLLLRDAYDLGGTVGMPHHMLRPEDPLREGLQVHRTIGVSRPIAPLEP